MTCCAKEDRALKAKFYSERAASEAKTTLRLVGLMRSSMMMVGLSRLILMLLIFLESSIVRLFAIVAPYEREDHSLSFLELISGFQKKLSLKILPTTRVSVVRIPGMD